MEESATFFKLNVLRSEPNRRSLQSFQSVVWLDAASVQELKKRLTLQNFLTKKTNSGGFYVNGVQGKQVQPGVGFFKITQKNTHQNIQYVCDVCLPASSPVIVFSGASVTRKSVPLPQLPSPAAITAGSRSVSVESEPVSSEPVPQGASIAIKHSAIKESVASDSFDLASGRPAQPIAIKAAFPAEALEHNAGTIPSLNKVTLDSNPSSDKLTLEGLPELSLPSDSAADLLHRTAEFLRLGQSLHKNDPSLFGQFVCEEGAEVRTEEAGERSVANEPAPPGSPKDSKRYISQVCNLLESVLAELTRLRISNDKVASILERYTLSRA